MISELRVGPQINQDGTTCIQRATKDGATTAQDAHGRYYESVVRGATFTAANAVAGVAPGTALSATPPLALWNPPNSGKNLIITWTSVGYVSGTLGAGTIVFAVVPLQTTKPTGGTQLVPQCNLIGSTVGVGIPFTGSTLVATPTIFMPLWTVGAALATTATFPASLAIEVNGTVIVPPGAVLAIQGIAAAGTTPLVIFALSWEEVSV
jgi:hypothetical protein